MRVAGVGGVPGSGWASPVVPAPLAVTCGRSHPLATHANPGIPCVSQVDAISPLEKFGGLEWKAEGPFKPVARSSATTSAWILAALSLSDAARRARPLQFVKRPMALLPDGALETAARWSKKRRRRSQRRGRLATRRGVSERERRHNPG